MGTYIHFSEEQKLRAGAVDLEEFLRLRGEHLIKSGRDKRLASDHSVTVRGNTWYDHSAQRGGGPVSFVQRFYRKSYPEAIALLLNGEQGAAYPLASEKQEEPKKPFELPLKNSDMRRVYAYLMKQRHVGKDVISHFAHAETLYEDAEHHNCVFVGTDENGIPRHAHLRSTSTYGEAFRINVESSDPRYSFHHIGTDGQLFVFEAPIDMLSYITMHPENWQEHSYVACCGTSIIPVEKMIERIPETNTVYLCLDNDILLMFDEVQVGSGRTGKLFAYQNFGVEPDCCSLAKALGSGVPVAAICAKGDAAKTLTPGTHGSTFAGGPLACALAETTLDVMINEGVIDNAAKVGEYFRKRAHEVVEKNHPDAIDEIRGLGLINGIQLKKDSGQPVVDACFQDSKVLINNTNGNVLRFIPPLVTTEEEVDIVIDAVDKAMTKLGW